MMAFKRAEVRRNVEVEMLGIQEKCRVRLKEHPPSLRLCVFNVLCAKLQCINFCPSLR